MEQVLVLMALVGQAENKMSAWNLIMEAGLVVKFVLLILVLFSVLCWAIIAFKMWQLQLAKRESKAFQNAFWAGESLEQVLVTTKRFIYTPMAHVFRAGMAELEHVRKGGRHDDTSGTVYEMGRAELGIENVERALRQASTTEMNRLTRFLSFLATTGSTAPFIGLFGTVWGIMNSFQHISMSKGAGFEVVGQGISEALIATAVGLAAAIPAVMAYNYFLSGLRVIQSELDNFQIEFINIVERHFMRKIRQDRPAAAPEPSRISRRPRTGEHPRRNYEEDEP